MLHVVLVLHTVATATMAPPVTVAVDSTRPGDVELPRFFQFTPSAFLLTEHERVCSNQINVPRRTLGRLRTPHSPLHLCGHPSGDWECGSSEGTLDRESTRQGRVRGSSLRGCFRVRATDYWNRTSVTSEAACMLAAGRAAKTDDGEAMRSPAFLLAHKTDDHDLRASQVTTVEEDLETLIQEALRVYHKIQKLEVMGGEEGLRKRILSYGAGLAPDDPQRVIRAREFLGVVKRRFAKLLKDEL
jgi:hypothetical protein